MGKRTTARLMLIGCLTLLSGCGAELALVGVASKGASSVLSHGKLYAARTNSFPRVVNACRRTIRDLGFRVVGVRFKDGKRWDAHVKDDLGALIKFRVTRRTSKLCQLLVDVGWFGSPAVARVIYERIEFYLDHRQSHATGPKESTWPK